MRKLKVATIALVALTGCESMFVNPDGIVKDIASGETTAQIVTPNAHYCRIEYPVMAHRITVDAGPVLVVQKCLGGGSSNAHIFTDGTPLEGLFGGSSSKTALRTFYFDAQPGHSYELTEGCLYSHEGPVKDKAEPIACAPLMVGRQSMDGSYWTLPDSCLDEFALRKQKDTSVRRNTDHSSIVPFSRYWLEHCVDDPSRDSRSPDAMVIAGGITPRQDTCWPSVQSGWLNSTRTVILGLKAGLTRLEASCDEPLPNSGYRVRTASFDLDVKAGHVYTLSAKNDVCMGLLDITDEKTLLVCEPYHERPE